jgi:holliday junction DNA helicase RuvA
LQGVQGVGAKVSLAVLSTLSPSDLANAVALRDIAMVARAPGVGKKVAERIVTELKSKAPAFAGDAAGTIGLKQELGEGCCPCPGRRRGLGADQSRLFARRRRQCGGRGPEGGW